MLSLQFLETFERAAVRYGVNADNQVHRGLAEKIPRLGIADQRVDTVS